MANDGKKSEHATLGIGIAGGVLLVIVLLFVVYYIFIRKRVSSVIKVPPPGFGILASKFISS